MRVMVIIQADESAQAGQMPGAEFLAEMHRYNQDLVDAGLLQVSEALQPTASAKRVTLSRKRTTVVDGPFTESKELIAGFWIWKVKSMEEAVEWVKRMPKGDGDGEGTIDIRPIWELEDVSTMPAEVIEGEARLRAEAAKNK